MAAVQGLEDPARITAYHAHVYYDAATRPLAAQLREAIGQRFEVGLGRWHDAPIDAPGADDDLTARVSGGQAPLP
jgi:aromatic ring-cleaving dioxygenase